MFSGIARTWRGWKRAYSRLTDPVCQDLSAVMYGTYRGELVLLVPVMDPHDSGRVANWSPAPSVTTRMDEEYMKEKLEREKKREEEEKHEAEHGRCMQAQGLNPRDIGGL